MGKRGPKPKPPPVWSAELAYGIGLLVTDGCLSGDGRHITLVSKDIVQLENAKKAFNLKSAIGYTRSGYDGNLCPRIQFGNVTLYNFLLEIGLMPNKSKVIGSLKIPDTYFFDFLRGHLDGDGCTYSYWDPRWRSSYMFYTVFGSASKVHIVWLRDEIRRQAGIEGHVTGKGKARTIYQLKYAKKESLILLRRMYYRKNSMHLPRKRLKIQKMLSIVGEQL
ncbi:hypothetical protein EXS62_00875 [Candidatus Kaiserbacteria bacterium]|nr:hypothetical protein [Candidatus Kaiserbacteria bacterium]